MNRRRLLGGLAAASALTLLPGCKEVIESVAESCPSDPAESAGVTWIPDAAQPVFWGFHDLTKAAGAPRDLQVFYPSYGGTPQNAPMLKLCVTRWPVVLFLHGQPPAGISTIGWHRKWWQIPATLARCGYVVVVPNHNALLPEGDTTTVVAEAMRDINFVRSGWSESNWVDKRPTSTAVAGHSMGALLAVKIAAAHQDIAALVSLSGRHLDFNQPLAELQAVTAPSLFMWAKEGADSTLLFENLDGQGANQIWDKLTQPKYAAPFKGEHFDYLRAEDVASALRGPCPLIGGVAADLTALFIAANLTVSVSRTKYPVDLRPPAVELTREQMFFAGAHLQSIERIATQPGCRVDLRWNVNGTTGSRRLGP